MFKKLGHKIEVLIRWVSIWITRIWRFMTHDVFLLNEEDFSRWKARLVRDAKTVLLMLNTFSDQKIGYQVTALAYRSMMAVVPAIAIGLYLTDGLGMRDKFQEILVDNLRDTAILDKLLVAADNIVNTAESGLFGFISMASFVWIVLSLMITVRQVFNNVWKVEREPSFFKMMGIVFGITILAPFVVIMFFSGSVVYSHVLDLLFPSKLFFSDHLKNFLSWALFAGIVVLILHTMYKFIPGTRVRSRHSFKAALISGLLFVGVQYLYLETQVMVAKTSAVYGALAAIPLFMIWLNLGWTIILYGAELSYAFQNVDRHSITIAKLDEMNKQAVQKRKERLHQNKMSL
ncbi:MAG: YihY/virulence factor BrkB family protein [Bacteroidales bacterium]|jgi:membrane protein|nr:YihY/virulence factor BrkB family protein [Bacteroidales bacterium]